VLRGVQQAARSTILNSVSQQHLIVAVAPLRRYVVRAVQERVCERVAQGVWVVCPGQSAPVLACACALLLGGSSVRGGIYINSNIDPAAPLGM
jgi:hypothetical protein